MAGVDTFFRRSGRRTVVVVALTLVVCAIVGFVVSLVTRDDLVLGYVTPPPGAVLGQEPTAVVMMDEGTIHVTAMGSSSCPAVPIDVAIVDEVVVGTVDADSDGPCTADYGPTTSVIAIPDALKHSGDVPEVTVENA